jgi:hypothetical protein
VRAAAGSTSNHAMKRIVHHGAVQLKLRGSVTGLLRPGVNGSSPTLRTRIHGIAESTMVNNWVDSPLKIIR